MYAAKAAAAGSESPRSMMSPGSDWGGQYPGSPFPGYWSVFSMCRWGNNSIFVLVIIRNWHYCRWNNVNVQELKYFINCMMIRSNNATKLVVLTITLTMLPVIVVTTLAMQLLLHSSLYSLLVIIISVVIVQTDADNAYQFYYLYVSSFIMSIVSLWLEVKKC